MKLSERKKKILGLVVDDYINTAQPVSSKSITEKYMSDISSATVRSELAGLEEMGYLIQPHTSSGRIPSPEAYKLYVSELMDKSKLTSKEIGFIKESFREHANNLEEVVQNAVKVISDLTDYTSVAYANHDEENVIVKIDIFRYKKNQALLLMVTENTLIRDKFIDIPENMTDAQIVEASEMISKLFVGKKFSEIMKLSETISKEFDRYREIFDSVISAIEDYVSQKKPEIFLEGEGKILHQPEYNDQEKAKNFLSVITSKDRLASLLKEDNDDIEINIKIGGEDKNKDLEDCSLVTATYSASGVKIGTYGVIGPLRMDYQKVVSVLEGVGKILEDIIKSKKG
ncbi:MAG: heat-inducible transcription repressor HrcA [Firmicutes bacterium]|nr:heat-inducible transcription repressor HrcA [Candidatus Caballimonas caccae]